MDNELIHEIAYELIDAEEKRTAIERFTKNRYPDLTVEQAYHIQEAVVQTKRVDGHKVVAPKMGLTSKAKWDQMGVDTPIYGYIFDDMEVKDTIEYSKYIHPKIEAEIGIVLSEDLEGANLTRQDVTDKIAYVFSAVEIIDSRYKDFDFKLGDVIADNASAKGYVFSEDMIKADEFDMVEEVAQIIINGEVVTEGQGKNVLDHPVESIIALAKLLSEKGQGIKKNEPIMTGGMTPAVRVQPGDVIEVKYTTLPTINLEVK